MSKENDQKNRESRIRSISDVFCREYSIIFKDNTIIIAFFAAALIFPFLYGYIYSNEVVREVPIAIVDLDNSALGRDITRNIDATEFVNVVLKTNNFEEAKKAFYNDEVKGIALIPKDFRKKIMRQEQAHISAYLDVSYFLYYKQVMKGIRYGTGFLSAKLQINNLMLKGNPKELAMRLRDPISHVNKYLFNPASGYSLFLIPAIIILALQQTLLIAIGMIGGFSREERRFTDLIPLSKDRFGIETILLGKTLAYLSFFVIFATMVAFLLFSTFNYPVRGSLIDVFIFLTPFFPSVIFFAFVLTSFFKSKENSIMFLVFSGIPCLFLTGVSWPKIAIPEWLQAIALIFPSTSAVDGFLKITQMGASLSEVYQQWAVLWGLNVIYFTVAVVLWRMFFRKEAESLSQPASSDKKTP